MSGQQNKTEAAVIQIAKNDDAAHSTANAVGMAALTYIADGGRNGTALGCTPATAPSCGVKRKFKGDEHWAPKLTGRCESLKPIIKL